MQPVTADETAVWEFLADDFGKKPPRGRFIELGCGPTVHHILPFAPHVSEIQMADYLDENLEQVRIWQANSGDAHNWNQYTEFTLKCEGTEPSPDLVATREQLAREKISRLTLCDLKKETPAEFRGQYDTVGCFYCAEEVGIDIEEWRQVMRRATDYLAPGGTFYMAALLGMETYDVRDESGNLALYPCACISEQDVRDVLDTLGFPKESIRLATSDIENPDCGVTGTLCLAATR